MTYLASGCGVSILFREEDSIEWFLNMVKDKGGVVTYEPIPED